MSRKKRYQLEKPSARVLKEMQEEHFRVAIFGSSKIKRGDETYRQIFELAKRIGQENIDIVTGGGPGLMEAANRGHKAGSKDNPSHSFGLLIDIPNVQEVNRSLDVKKEFRRFTGRLDTFMALSNIVIVAPGGIGTTLELFYTWQLIQVDKSCEMPVILLGKMWRELMKWVKKWPLKKRFMDPRDMKTICLAKGNDQAMEIITSAHGSYLRGKTKPINLEKYQIYKIRKRRRK
tara:strand:- start:481 stop:1179 length:699 start_codon:yes stop_codon:yes gene_type:complete